MCRNIKPLFNLEPPVTEQEIREASLQFVRKVSGFTRPSRKNQAAFDAAVDEITGTLLQLLGTLQASVAPRDREELAARAKARSAQRFDQ